METFHATDLLKLLANRPLVPFLGAGISVASGFPSIKQLNQYLAKVDFAIEHGVYSHRYASQTEIQEYYNHPSRFLADFGWPEIGQLDADLWQWFTATKVSGKEKIRVNVERIKRKDVPEGEILSYSLPMQDKLSYDLTKIVHPDRGIEIDTALDQRDFLRAIVQFHLRRDLRRLESGADDAALRQWKRWKRWYFGDLRKNKQDLSLPDAAPDLLYGNWESLLDHLCEGSFDLVDQLFTQMEIGRHPTLAHRYLSFLKQKLDSPLFLTTNFDNFIEQALTHEAIDFRTFDIHRDAQLPDAEIVKRQFSIIKLHGSSFGLRLGERLRYPLDENSQTQILKVLPKNAVLLVMGFSGYERRMLQLLRIVAEQGPYRGRCDGLEIHVDPRIVWLTRENLQGWPGQLQKDYPKQIRQIKIADAGIFLQELYFRLGKAFPASQRKYPALTDHVIRRPVEVGETFERSKWLLDTVQSNLASCEDTNSNQRGQSNPLEAEKPITSSERIGVDGDLRRLQQSELRKPVHIFVPSQLKEWLNHKKRFPPSDLASCGASEFVSYLGHEYRPIWINFENHHTVAGVISEFFAKARAFDPYCPRPPLNLPSIVGDAEDFDVAHEKVITRILDVFQSGKYVLVLDTMESFGRPQTMHHGIPTYDVFASEQRDFLVASFTKRVHDIRAFLSKLIEGSRIDGGSSAAFGESHICITVGGPPSRRFNDTDTPEIPETEHEISKFIEWLLNNTPKDFCDEVCTHWVNSYPGSFSSIRSHASRDEEDTWHWFRCSDREKTHERSDRRLRDIESLFAFLKAKDEIALPARAEMAFWGVLSLFRRARPVPVVQSFIERWLTTSTNGDEERSSWSSYSRIQTLLDVVERKHSKRSNARQRFAEYCEGDYIWMYRESRDSIYESLTELLSVKFWVGELSSEKPTDIPLVERMLIDGVVVFTWHWAAARTYYADVYRPTQDITAFYEYLYHRISALRILTLMQAVITKTKAETNVAAAIAKKLSAFSPLGNMESTDDFMTNLSKLREEGLTTLQRALLRNRDMLRRNATPSTLKSWAHQFLDREIHDLSGSVYSGVKDMIFPPLGYDFQSQINSLIESLNRRRLQTISEGEVLEGAAYHDQKSDIALIELIEFFQRLRTDAEAADLAFSEARLQSEERIRVLRDAVPKAKCLLNLTDALNAAVHDKWSMEMEHPVETKTLGEGSLLIREYVEQQFAGELRSTDQLRKFLELRAKWGQHVFPHWRYFFSKRLAYWGLAKEVKDEKALAAAEGLAIEYEKVLRSTATQSDDDRRHRTSALILRARSLYLRDKYRESHKWLDLAAAGLAQGTPEQRLSLGAVHLNRGELLVHSACWHRYSKRNTGCSQYSSIESRIDLLEAVAECPIRRKIDVAAHLQKIRRAMIELTIADEMLTESPQFPIWRINSALGLAICCSEELMYELDANIEDLSTSGVAKRYGDLERRVLKGMGYIRNALDTLPVSLGHDNASAEELEKFCYCIWHQLYVMFLVTSSKYRAEPCIDVRQHAVTVLSRASAWANKDIERWINWGRAMRMVRVAEDAERFAVPPEVFESVENCKYPSLSAAALLLSLKELSIGSLPATSFPERFFNKRRVSRQEKNTIDTN